MRKLKWFVLALCAAVMTLMMTACGEKFDPAAYVKASLDAALHGEFASYMELTGATEEEAAEEFSDILKEFNEDIGEIGLSDSVNEQYEQLMTDLCRKTKYQVKGSREVEGGYEVDVEIEPITNVFDAEALEQDLTDVVDDYLSEVMASGEIPSEEEITQWAEEQMYALLAEKVDNIEYGDPKTVTIKIEKTNGSYAPDDNDLEEALVLMLGADAFLES